jgi:hypothetical protein
MSAWLIKYLTNSSFRNSQELEAYLVQCHEIGIFYGKKSFEYSSFLAELPYLTNNSLTTINSRIADLWEEAGKPRPLWAGMRATFREFKKIYQKSKVMITFL